MGKNVSTQHRPQSLEVGSHWLSGRFFSFFCVPALCTVCSGNICCTCEIKTVCSIPTNLVGGWGGGGSCPRHSAPNDTPRKTSQFPHFSLKIDKLFLKKRSLLDSYTRHMYTERSLVIFQRILPARKRSLIYRQSSTKYFSLK